LTPDDFEKLLRKKHRAVFGAYVPTPVGTNTSGGADTNSIAAQLASLPPERRGNNGAALLMGPINAGGKTPQIARGGGKSASLASGPAAGAAPMSRAQLELADMEDQLVKKIEVTSDDFRDVMQRRAN